MTEMDQAEQPSSPVAAAGPAGPVGRSVGEIRADLAHCDRDGVPWPEAARRLLADVPGLLAEVEAAHRFEVAAGVEREALLAEVDELRAEVQQLINAAPSVACPLPGCSGDQCVLCEGAMRLPVCEGTDAALAAVFASVQREADKRFAEADRLRGVVQAVEAPDAIEAAAIALYEDTRQPGSPSPEWDWPNIDRSYDKDDEDETDPEWLRNIYRREARVAIRAALAAAADAPQPEPPAWDGKTQPPHDDFCGTRAGEFRGWARPSPAQPADPPTPQQRYDQARRDGLSEHEARAVGWPGVTFCGHTAEEGCTGHGDF